MHFSGWRFAGRMLRPQWVALAVLAAMVAMTANRTATAEDLRRQTGESFLKGHRLVTFINEMTHQATIELDGVQILAKDDVAEIGKLKVYDLETAVLYAAVVKTRKGCVSSTFVHAPLTGDTARSQTLSDFGACGDLMTIELSKRKGWALFAAIAYRNDRATAQVAFTADNKLTLKEIKARPCMFVITDRICMSTVLAEAMGSGELGLLTGSGSFGDRKVESFFNRATDKATIRLDGRIYRSFDNAKEFYLAQAEGTNDVKIFVFYLKPATGCQTRPLLLFTEPKGEPSLTMDFAPCTDHLAGVTRTKGNAIQWFGIAFRLGEAKGHIVSVIDRKLSTRISILPVCMMTANTMNENSCLLEALGQAPPMAAEPPKLRIVPGPPPPGRKPPSTLGI